MVRSLWGPFMSLSMTRWSFNVSMTLSVEAVNWQMTPYFFATLDISFNASTERVAGHIAVKATSNVPIHSVVGQALWMMVILSSWCLSLSFFKYSSILDDTSNACTDRHRLAKGMA